jgi:2-polyprenyl-3-methyl-5-hydroxy-6-metoxy-1,4-benzoquinol methylase
MKMPTVEPAQDEVNDKAGKAYWDTVWTANEVPQAVDPRNRNINNFVNRRLHRFFQETFAGLPERADGKRRLLEIGCAQSAWLPYFHREFGFEVCGLDYSELGCEQERKVLAQAGVQGEVVCADLFAPPGGLQNSFDAVVSFGVVEHFQDTAGCIEAFAAYLAPGGIVVTIIPNMNGVTGWTQRKLNRAVYDIHVPLNAPELGEAHRKAGLEVLQNGYFLFTNFGIPNLNGLDENAPSTQRRRKLLLWLTRLSKIIWLWEDHLFRFPVNRWTSPLITCVARKRDGR